MYSYLKNNKRMGKPMWCNDEMYDLMLDCWNWKPRERPQFAEIIERLEVMFVCEAQSSVSGFRLALD